MKVLNSGMTAYTPGRTRKGGNRRVDYTNHQTTKRDNDIPWCFKPTVILTKNFCLPEPDLGQHTPPERWLRRESSYCSSEKEITVPTTIFPKRPAPSPPMRPLLNGWWLTG